MPTKGNGPLMEDYKRALKAGEASGQLDVILQRLADYMESVEELKREIKGPLVRS